MATGRARQPRFPQAPSLQEMQQGALTIEQMANQSDRQQQDLYEKELQLADDDKAREDGAYFQSLFEENGGDLDKSWDAMVRRNAPLAYQMRDMDTKSRMEAGKQAQAALTNQIAEAQRASTIMSADPTLYQEDPEAWAQAVGELPARFQENAPPEYDQAFVDNIMNLSESEADEAARSQANITGILEGSSITHSRRELGRANDEKEWNDTIQVLLSLKGMNQDAIRQAIGSMSLEYPGPERVKEIYDSGFTMDELGAQERNDADNAQRDEELEVRRGELELARERFEAGQTGGEGSLRDLIAKGEPGHAAWQLQWARWGKEYGEAGPPLDVIEAAHAEIVAAVGESGDTGALDPVAVRGANATYAEDYEPPPPGADVDSEEYREWYQDNQELQQRRDIGAGRGAPPAAAPSAGPPPIPEERRSVYKQIAADGGPEAAAKQFLIDNGAEPTPEAIRKVLQDYPELSEGGGGGTIGSFLGGIFGNPTRGMP